MLKKYIDSIRYANQGLRYFFKHDTHAKIHLLASICIITVGFILHFSWVSWVLVILCIGLVFAAEMFNSAIEKLCDKVEPDQHPQIKIIKDLAAAAVWTTSLMSAVIGGILIYQAW